MVHVGFVLEFALVATRITYAKPRFEADERSVLLIRTPESDDGTTIVQFHSHATIRIEQFHAACLTLVQFHGVVDEELIIEVDENELRADIAANVSEVGRRYRRGKALSKVEVLSQEMALAKVGSPLALENVQKNLLDMEDDE